MKTTSDELNPRMELTEWYEKQNIIFGKVSYDRFDEYAPGQFVAIKPPYEKVDYGNHVFVRWQPDVAHQRLEVFDYVYLDKLKVKKE